MDVTITQISPDTINALRLIAQRNGQSLEDYVRLVIERETKSVSMKELRIAEKREAFRAWVESHDENTPVLSDEAMSRESVYKEREDKQL